MVNKVHGSCSTLVPRGPGYKDLLLLNQACTMVGPVPGQPYSKGERFAQLAYRFLIQTYGWCVVYVALHCHLRVVNT
jgi:hypothetical protein